MKKFKNDPRTFALTGEGGEQALISQLILRGENPFRPVRDMNGIDILLLSGCKIQIKTARICTTYKTLKKNLDGVYRFSFANFYYKNRSERGKESIEKNLSKKIKKKAFYEYCDIVVLIGVDNSYNCRFWIVPAKLLDRKTNIDLGPDNSRGFSKDVPEMREMLNAGFTQKQVGEKFGISQAAVNIRLKRAGTKIYLSKISRQIRECENAWDKILNFGKPETNEIQVVGDNNKWQTLGVSSQSGLADTSIMSTIQ
jgi:hypothetical protein